MEALELFLPIILLAFICEFIDSSLGMGYGTTLTPLLLLMGYNPLQIVPAILLSELFTGFGAAFFHHKFKNVNFKIGNSDLKVALIMGGCSVFGALIAVLLALSLPAFTVKLYIGVLVFIMGVIILATLNRSFPFSWKKIVGLGLLAAFNKGISGGGYGPVVTGGQILSGVKEKNAIGIASLAIGVGSAAIEYATQYVKEREAFGQKLSRFQAIQWMIADSYTELEAAQLLTLRAASLKESGQGFTKEASMAKLLATETAKEVALRSVQMLGGYGYTTEYPVERYLRDIIGTTLYEGTSEVQRIVISREILGR